MSCSAATNTKPSCQVALDDGIVRWLKEYTSSSIIYIYGVRSGTQSDRTKSIGPTKCFASGVHCNRFPGLALPKVRQPSQRQATPSQVRRLRLPGNAVWRLPFSLSLSLAVWLSLTCLSQRACHPTAEGGHFEYICRVLFMRCRCGGERRGAAEEVGNANVVAL